MGWTTPLTATTNAALTAAQWNASVRDNLNETEPAKATTGSRLIVTKAANALVERDVVAAYVGTTETTTSGPYVDLKTYGPEVNVTTGTAAIVSIGCYCSNNTGAERAWMSHAISGAHTASPSDSYAAILTSAQVNEVHGASQVTLWKTLSAGSNIFTAKYRVSYVGTGSWRARRIIVMAL